MQKLLYWWEKSIFAALCVATVLLGVGRLEFAAPKGSMSAWSVSRTTFFFWLIYRLLTLLSRGRPRVDWAKLRPWVALFLFFVIVTVSLLPNFRFAGDYRYFAFACAHALMVADLFATPARQKWLLYALGVVPLVLVVRGFIHDPTVFSFAVASRFGFPLDHPNTAGYLLSMSVPLCLLAASAERGWWRGLAFVSFAAQLPALLLTYSRGAWLGSSVAMVFLAVTMKRRREVAAILILTALVATFVTPLQSRFSTLLSPRSDLSIMDRLQVIDATLKLALANPVLGVGYGRDRLREGLRESRLEMRRIAHTHNVYVELLATTGLLGLGAFLWLICGAFYQALRHSINREAPNRSAQLGIAATWIAFAVTGLGDVPFYHHETRIFFFSLVALTYLYARDASTDVSPIRRP